MSSLLTITRRLVKHFQMGIACNGHQHCVIYKSIEACNTCCSHSLCSSGTDCTCDKVCCVYLRCLFASVDNGWEAQASSSPQKYNLQTSLYVKSLVYTTSIRGTQNRGMCLDTRASGRAFQKLQPGRNWRLPRAAFRSGIYILAAGCGYSCKARPVLGGSQLLKRTSIR